MVLSWPWGVYANDQGAHVSLHQCAAWETVQCGLLIIMERGGRIEDTEEVKSNLGRCQDVTSRMTLPSTARGKYDRDLRG